MVRRWRKLVVGMRNSNVYHGFHCLYLVLVSFLVIFFLVFCLLLRSCGMKLTSRSIRLLLLSSGLLGGLSDFSGTGFFLGDGLDDSDGHRLPHIADGEATKRRVVDERFHRQRLGRRHLHNSRVTVLDSFGESLELFSGTAIASTGGKVKLFLLLLDAPRSKNRLDQRYGVSIQQCLTSDQKRHTTHFFRISSNLQAMWAVWQSRTGAYPFLISPGWFKTMTCRIQ